MKTVGRGRCNWLTVLGLIATLFAFGATARSDPPKPVCNGALIGDPAGIIAACTAYIAANPPRTPALARAFTWRGRAYADSGEPDRAIDDLNQAIDIEPSATALNIRAAAYRMKGNTVQALADYERSLALKRDELTFLGISQTHWSHEQYDLALRSVNEAIMLRPGDASFYHIRGNIYRDSGQFGNAIRDYDKALELVPWLEEVRAERCVALSLVGKPEEGLADCNRAVEKASASTLVFLNRGAVYLRLNRPDDAVADFERILKDYPGDLEALYARGVARRLKGDIAGSDADFVAVGGAADAIAYRLEKIGVKP